MSRTNHETPEARRARLESEIAVLRGEVGGLVGELEARLRRSVSVRYQVVRHPLATAAGVVAVTGTVAVVLGVRARRRRAREAHSRAGNLVRALRVLASHPEAVEDPRPRYGPVGVRAGLLSAVKTAAGLGGKRAARVLVGG